MANIIVIENDPRVLRQIKQFIGELDDDEHKVRYFDSNEAFEARYFNKSNLAPPSSPLAKLPTLKAWKPVQFEWLLQNNLETTAPFQAKKLTLTMDLSTQKVVAFSSTPAEGEMILGQHPNDLKIGVNPLSKLIPTLSQSEFQEFQQKAMSGQKLKQTFALSAKDPGFFWIIEIEAQLKGEQVLFTLENQTDSIRPTFTDEKKKLQSATEEGVELDLLAKIDLIIFKLNLIKDFKKGWIQSTAEKIKKFKLQPQVGKTKFILLKYEDDGVKKVELLFPQLSDIIYLPLDRALFLQKMDIILADPELIKPRFLFEQEVNLKINLAKRTTIEHISDVGIGVKNPIALKTGLLGHFFFTLPGQDQELEVFGKVQKSIPHPEDPKQFIVYFVFIALSKKILSNLRLFLSKNPRYQNFVNDDKNEFHFNPDNIFLTDNERRIKNVVIITPDPNQIQQLSKNVSENMDQVRVVGQTSYQDFLKANFADESTSSSLRDLNSVQPTSEADFNGPSVHFFINSETKSIEAPLPPENLEEKILGHLSVKLLSLSNAWQSLLLPLDDDKAIFEESLQATLKGRKIHKTFIVSDGMMEPRLIHMSLEKSPQDGLVKVTLSPADAKVLYEKRIMEAPIETVDLMVIDSHFVPEDPSSWIEGLTMLCKKSQRLPPDNELKILVIGADEKELDPRAYDHPQIKAVLQSPIDMRTFFLILSICTDNRFTLYNFANISWLDNRITVQIAKPVTIVKLSEFGGTLGSHGPIAHGTFLFLRGSIFDQAPNRNLCARFYANEKAEEGDYPFLCHLIYFGINEGFMKYARSYFRETYAASKQQGG